MLKSTILALVALVSQFSVAQELDDYGDEKVLAGAPDTLHTVLPHFTFPDDNVLIPYRIGEKWGMSDTLGNLIVPAAYDEIFVGNNVNIPGRSDQQFCKCIMPDKHFTYGYYIIRSGEKFGVVNQRGTIIPPKYDRLEFSNEFFVVADRDHLLFNMKGELLEDSISGISELFFDTGVQDLYVFEAVNGLKNGIFLYDSKQQRIVKWLISGKKYIVTRSCGTNRTLVVVKDGGQANYKLLSFDKKTKQAVFKPVLDNEIDQVLGFDKLPMVSAHEQEFGRYRKDTILTISTEWSKVGQDLKLKVYTGSYYENCKISKVDTARFGPFDEINLQILRSASGYQSRKTYYLEFKGPDSIVRPWNYAVYQVNEKYGYAIGRYFSGAVFDTAYIVMAYLHNPRFIVSKKVNGNIKWGIIDESGHLVADFNYDSLSVTRGGIIATRGKFQGILNFDGTVIAEPVCDNVTYEVNRGCSLYKDGLYGFSSGGLVEPFSKEPLKGIHLQRIGTYEVFQLLDEEGSVIGYRSRNGFNFFKD